MPLKNKPDSGKKKKKSGLKKRESGTTKTSKSVVSPGKKLKRLQIQGIGSSDEKFMSIVEANLALECAEKTISAVEQPLLVLDENHKIISANHFFCDTFKVNPKEIKGELFYKLGKGEWDSPKLKELLSKLSIKGTSARNIEIKQSIPIIGERTLRLTARTIHTRAKKARFILLGIKVVTELKKAEESASQLASFPQMNPMPVLEIEPSGKVLYMNPAARKLFPGLPKKKLAYPYLKGILSAVTELKAGKGEWIQRELEINGNWYAQTIVLVNGGSNIRIYAADITKSKKAEQALHSAKDDWEQTFDTVPDLLAVLDEHHRIIRVNRAMAERLGLAPDKCVGLHCYETVHGSQEPPAFCPHSLTCKNKKEHLAEVYEPRLGGYFLVSTTPRFDQQGRFIGSVHVARDITERKRAEQELREAKENLEIRVKERTRELQKSNLALQAEISERKKAEEIIRAEQQRFNDVLETLPAYIVLLTPDYHVLSANRFFRERFGESHGNHCYEYLFGRTEPCENCETYKVLKTNSPHHWEWTGPDGRNYDIYDYPFKDVDGSTLILEMGIDITERKKAEVAVQAERKRLFDVLETLPAMICLLTPDYHVAFANRSFRERFGESEGRHCYESCHGKSQPCDFCESFKVFKSGKPHHWEVTTAEGKVIDVYDFPFTDVDGSPMILEMDVDITERRQAEVELRKHREHLEEMVKQRTGELESRNIQLAAEVAERERLVVALRQSEEQAKDQASHLQALLDVAPAVIWIAHDRECRKITANRYGEDLLRVKEGTNVSKSGAEQGKLQHYRVFKDGRELAPEEMPIQRVAASGKSLHDYGLDIVFSDGSMRSLLGDVTPLFDPQGRPDGAIAVFMDVTERRKASQALRETSEYLESLFNYANAPIICWDTKFKITRFNHAFEHLTDYKAEEVIGKDLGILFPEETKGESLGRIKRTLSGEYWEVVEIPIRRKDGQERIALWNSANVYAEDGKTIIATIAQGQDITDRKRIEDVLRETTNYLENLFNYANAPIICWDTKFKITRFNHAFEHLTDYKAEEVLGRDLSILFPEKTKEESLSKIKQTLSGEYWEVVEIPILRKDREVRIALWNSANVYAEDGKTIIATIAQGQDITQRKKAEEAVRVSLDRYRSYIEATGQLGWVTNGDGEVVEDIPYWRAYTGQSYEEIKGWGWSEALHPDDLENTSELWRKAVATKSLYEIEYRIRRHDGTYRHFLARGIPVLREDGSVREWVGTCIDITERKQAEDTLKRLSSEIKEERDLLEIIKENTNAHLAYLDRNFNFIRVNSTYAKGSGHSMEELIGKNHFDLFPNEENEVLFKRVRDTGEPAEFKAKPFIFSDQPERGVTYWDWTLIPVKDGSGKVQGLVLSLIDITEIKKTEEAIRALNETLRSQAAELAASNKELEAFSYSVSHDLRAPLRNIDGFSQALLEDYNDKFDQKGRDYLKRIRAGTQRMGELIDDLLNLSVMVRKEMRREEVNISQQAKTIMDELKNTAPERQVEIKIQDGLRVSGDPLLLRQLLENLLGNAWKFTSGSPLARIELGSIEKDGKKAFFIKDDGAGFDMKYINKMFIPFQRLHSVEEFSGNGVGLAIVKRIVDRHGGRVWAEGEVGKGATFYFTLE